MMILRGRLGVDVVDSGSGSGCCFAKYDIVCVSGLSFVNSSGYLLQS